MALILATNEHAKDFWPENWTSTRTWKRRRQRRLQRRKREFFMKSFRLPSEE
ncbi:hypothetical protein AAVH_42447, partial [Aphelenchoides avenae]